MVYIYILGSIYAVIGLVYALYITLNGIDKWQWFLVNWALGPVVMIYNYYKFMIKKKIPR